MQLPAFTSVPLRIKTFLFVCGFAVLALEILGIKVLAPHIGAAMPVWGGVISVTLLGGMFGYYQGGAAADRIQSSRFIALLAASGGIFIGMIPALKPALPTVALLPNGIGGFAGSLLFLFIPVTLLCASVTYVIRVYVRRLESIAQVHGDLYAIATVGSIVGVFATSYLLVPFFAVSHILYALGAAVIVLGFALAPMYAQN